MIACDKCYRILWYGGTSKQHVNKCCGSVYEQSVLHAGKKRSSTGQFTGVHLPPRLKLAGNVPDLDHLLRTESTRVSKILATHYRSSFVTGVTHTTSNSIVPHRGIVGDDDKFYNILIMVREDANVRMG